MSAGPTSPVPPDAEISDEPEAELIGLLVDTGHEHIARQRYGDARVDDWFRVEYELPPGTDLATAFQGLNLGP